MQFAKYVVDAKLVKKLAAGQITQLELFDQAQTSWEWVNQDVQKSFILVADPALCNSGLSLDPWLVDHAKFDSATLEVRLDAAKKEWTEVIYEYKIDFGAADTGTAQKRSSIFDRELDAAFKIPLTRRTFGSRLFGSSVKDPINNAIGVQFGVNCIDCGLFGRLKFIGHIKGNFLGVTQLDASLTLESVHAALSLKFLFSGRYKLGMYGLPDLKKTFDIVHIPLPYSWKIDGIVKFGPKAKIQRGFEVDSIEGNAKLTAGCTATVPDDSVQPINLDPQVSALVNFYLQIVPAFDFVILKQRGLRAGLPIRLPNLQVKITAGEDPNGFCPGDPSPYGVKVQAPLDEVLEDLDIASRSLHPRAVNLKKGEITIPDKEIFDPPGYPFSLWCRSLPGKLRPPFVPEPDGQEWYDAEINSADDGDSDSLNRRTTLSPRADHRTRTFKCNGVSTEYKIKTYLGPSKLKRKGQAGGENGVPIMNPKIKRCQEAFPIDSWDVTGETETDNGPDFVVIEGNPPKTDWAVDHVYEVGWLAEFWKYLAVDQGLACPSANPNVPTINTQLLSIGQKEGYADKMLSKVVNSKTYFDMMIPFPNYLNELKHRMFANKELSADSASKNQSANQRACQIGQIVTVCKYMAMGKTRQRPENTLKALDKVFAEMDANCSIPHLEGTYVSAHRKWFTDLYNGGIDAMRKTLTKYAKFMLLDKNLAEFEKLDNNTKESITRISKLGLDSDWNEFCPNAFNYPELEPILGGLDSDPKNCGKCGNQSSVSRRPDMHRRRMRGLIFSRLTFSRFIPSPSHAHGRANLRRDIVLYDYPFLNTGSFILPQDVFVDSGGKLTLNTRCIVVSELEETGNSMDSTLSANAKFAWKRSSDGVEDSCCLAVFPGTSCMASERKEFCINLESYRMPFDAQSFMVYGCYGS
ncbi:hypothetical protein K458DRAFT_396285 [Lentithecium fluviatile CBS 122367]|uniref:Uncharacterized protein n=1 Tax=Lentithecium fluviatile CBS 122367 TaxID=1168545 RepID=A0A6G1IFN7_9PLEO|nr:hypothetical protein K458DRAFT_396285 [Lentithecium fluviatile CBS 122367]